MSVDIVLKETKPDMEAVVDDLKRKLTNVRTGRATVGLLDNIMVDYYGVPTQLSQMASINAPEAQMLTIQPWEAGQVSAIEKAINAANLGFSPSNDGRVIRLSIPPLTEERRRQLAKQVHEIAEEHKIAVRSVRQDANSMLKSMAKDKEISEDNERYGLDEVQKLTNTYTSKIDELAKTKEQEIMSV
jgi:ribosome recycling factor